MYDQSCGDRLEVQRLYWEIFQRHIISEASFYLCNVDRRPQETSLFIVRKTDTVCVQNNTSGLCSAYCYLLKPCLSRRAFSTFETKKLFRLTAGTDCLPGRSAFLICMRLCNLSLSLSLC